MADVKAAISEALWGMGISMNASLLFRAPTLLAAFLTFWLAGSIYAQQAPFDADLVSPSSEATSTVAVKTQPQTSQKQQPLTGRWLELNTLSHSERYRNAYNQVGFRYFDNTQQRSMVDGRLKLDARGQYAVGFNASSGRYFNWSYANYMGREFLARVLSPQGQQQFSPAQQQEVGISIGADPANFAEIVQIQSNGWQFYMRQLYFSATVVSPLTVEFGSFGLERGLSTEITTFDDDGYLTGERVRIHDAKHLFFDQIGLTSAYFGDVDTPNFFKRGSSLKKSNYRQAFVDKRVNARVGFSGEYTWLNGTNTLREAVVVGAKELKVFDSVRFEGYERVNTINLQGLDVKGGSGFAVAAERKLGKLRGDFGFASVDKDYSVYKGSRFFHAVGFSLNGDSYGAGKRYFAHTSYRINPVMTVFGYYTHSVTEDGFDFNKQGYSGGMTFNFKTLANTKKAIF